MHQRIADHFGHKQWSLAVALGYAIYESSYQRAAAEYDKILELGHFVVIDVVSELPLTFPFQMNIDNFFTGMSLLQENLEKQKQSELTGLKRVPIKHQELAKSKKVAFDYCSSHDGTICICSWRDYSVVTMALYVHSVFPLQNVSGCWTKEKREF